MKIKRFRKKMVDRSDKPGPRCKLHINVHQDEYNQLRVIADIKNESVPRLLVRMAQEWHMKQQMVVLTLPVAVVNDAFYLARHLGFESHEHWISQSITESVRAASKQFRDSGINLRNLLMKPPKEEYSDRSERQEGSQASNRTADSQDQGESSTENQKGGVTHAQD